jgi:hypothetical protein
VRKNECSGIKSGEPQSNTSEDSTFEKKVEQTKNQRLTEWLLGLCVCDEKKGVNDELLSRLETENTKRGQDIRSVEKDSCRLPSMRCNAPSRV